MQKCKNYIIYKFHDPTKMDSDIQRAKKWQRSQEFTNFKENLINAFADDNFDEIHTKLIRHHFGEERYSYKKDWLRTPFEIGLDMIKEKYGCKFEIHWDHDYWAVPKNQVELIEFFENNKPNWTTKVKKI